MFCLSSSSSKLNDQALFPEDFFACSRSPASGKIYDFTVTDIDGNEVQLRKYLGQEPGTDQEIKQRVLAKYNVTFDLFHKIDVNGENAIPLYKFLKQSLSSWFSREIEWNFVKFLVGRNGTPVSRYSSITPPNSMEAEIRKLLGLSNEL
ncbi:hypothetical protein MS3_00010046 [Schistosoma haematobium]|uniref:Uncharacterized protein n=1 Tax=Schistosoma haematobium TaxID=6185 RepID=A0A6A5DMD1_SCHHA|nr:hypothetical protein MS3_00010046 [Schistosoma haematobium]KAH9593830.1 hypothetical protein MS3_00010046 [Schistosoma haematobium]